MTDTQWKRRTNGAAYEPSGSSVTDRSAMTQERQAWRSTYAFFQSTIGQLKTRAERNLDASEELVEQAWKKREAGQNLIRASMDAYTDLLDSMFFYYRENARAAERGTREA